MAAGSCFKQQYVRKWEQKTTSKSICIFRVLRKRSHVQSPLYFQIHFYISDSDKIHFCIGTYMHPGTRCPLKIWSCWLVVLIVHSLFLSVSVFPCVSQLPRVKLVESFRFNSTQSTSQFCPFHTISTLPRGFERCLLGSKIPPMCLSSCVSVIYCCITNHLQLSSAK